MKKRALLSLFFSILLILSVSLSLYSCSETTEESESSQNGDKKPEDNKDNENSEGEKTENKPIIDINELEIPTPFVIEYADVMDIPEINNIPEGVTLTVENWEDIYEGPGDYELRIIIRKEGYEDTHILWPVKVVLPELNLWNSATPPTFYREYTKEKHFVEFEIPKDVLLKYPNLKVEYEGNGQSEPGNHKVEAIFKLSIRDEVYEIERITMSLVINSSCTVTLDTAGGNCETTKIEVAAGTSMIDILPMLPTPTKNGYTFSHWSGDPLFVHENITLTAVWNIINYSIVYHPQSEVIETDNPASFNIESPMIELKEPSMPGYTFLGWYDNSENGEKISTIDPSKRLENLTLYARWEISNYSITYISELSQDDPLFTFKTSYNINTEPFSVNDCYTYHYGYTFQGWYTEPLYENKVTVINPALYLSDIVLYAKYTVDVYEIEYRMNGGENAKENPANYTRFDSTIILADPKRDGYKFDGWYMLIKTSYGEKAEKVATLNPSENYGYTLEARWSAENYTVSYELDGGFFDGQYVSSYIISGNAISLSDPKRNYFVFDGWYKEAELINKVTHIPANSSGNLTFFAKWSPITYSITYDARGGVVDANSPSSYTYGSNVTLKGAEKRGYRFLGWHTSSNAYGSAYYITELDIYTPYDVTLYAYYEAIEYTITYDCCYEQVEPPFHVYNNPST